MKSKVFPTLRLVTLISAAFTYSVASQTTEEKIRAAKIQLIELNKQRIHEIEEENRYYLRDLGSAEADISTVSSRRTTDESSIRSTFNSTTTASPLQSSIASPIRFNVYRDKDGAEQRSASANNASASPSRRPQTDLPCEDRKIVLRNSRETALKSTLKVSGADTYKIVFKIDPKIQDIGMSVKTDSLTPSTKSISVGNVRAPEESIALEGKRIEVVAWDLLDKETSSCVTVIETDKKEAKKLAEGQDSDKLVAYFGTEIAGASSAESSASPYFAIQTRANIKQFGNGEDNRGKLTFFTDFKLSTTPSQTLPNFGSLQSEAISNFFSTNQSGSLNSLVKAFKVKAGLELGVGHGLSFITGGGVTSPLSSRNAVQAYKIPLDANHEVLKDFKDLFGPILGPDVNYSGKESIVFSSAERPRFLRNYFVGTRLRLDPGDAKAHPYQFDLTIGQDEALTKTFSGTVLKFDSNMPISIPGIGFLYFGAGFSMRLKTNEEPELPRFFLEPITSPSIFDNTKNFIVNIDKTPFSTARRDNYSFRIGVDLVALLKGVKNSKSNP